MRARLPLAVASAVVAVVACSREATPTRPPPGASGAAATAAPSTSASAPRAEGADAGAPAFALTKIPLDRPPRRGPLRVEGYPTPLSAGMSDPASPFGFTRDGSKLAYCAFDVCCANDVSECVLLDAAGKTSRLVTHTPYAFLEGKEKADAQPRTKRELQAFAREEGLVELGPAREMTRTPPAVTGSHAFGADLTIVVREIAPTVGKKDDGSDNVPGAVKIGGRLEGEREGFVVFPRAPFCTKNPFACYEAQLNGLALSPDERELGFVIFVRNPSHGSTFIPVRIPVTTFAARVLNDTGMVHHERKEWARAAELFTRAVYADPSEERFAFNLACALARQGDARAEHALRHAVARGGDAVRARAQKDADLAGVRGEAWFTSALR